MTLTTQQTTVGGTARNLLVGTDANGSLIPAHLLANSGGTEIGTAANPLAIAAGVLPLPAGAAADGTDATGIAPPAGASGIRGWLPAVSAAGCPASMPRFAPFCWLSSPTRAWSP